MSKPIARPLMAALAASIGLSALAAAGALFASRAEARPGPAPAAGPRQQGQESRMLAHMVYFRLKDDSPEARRGLVEACEKYLSGHEGTVGFAAGVLAEDLDRDVNVRDWHVSLHLVFEDRDAHEKYQTAPRHLRFIEENRDTWADVRVFDSDLLVARGAEESGR